MPDELRFSLPGNPITKKNSQQIVPAGKRFVVVPSEAYRTWAKSVAWVANRLHVDYEFPITKRVEVCATFWCASERRGDLNNYTSALADWLESAGILANDKQIESWDGSRVRIDRYKPRVDVVLREFVEADGSEQQELMPSELLEAT